MRTRKERSKTTVGEPRTKRNEKTSQTVHTGRTILQNCKHIRRTKNGRRHRSILQRHRPLRRMYSVWSISMSNRRCYSRTGYTRGSQRQNWTQGSHSDMGRSKQTIPIHESSIGHGAQLRTRLPSMRENSNSSQESNDNAKSSPGIPR